MNLSRCINDKNTLVRGDFMSKKISNGFVEVVDTSQFDETINSFRNAIKQYRNARNLVFNSTERLLSFI